MRARSLPSYASEPPSHPPLSPAGGHPSPTQPEARRVGSGAGAGAGAVPCSVEAAACAHAASVAWRAHPALAGRVCVREPAVLQPLPSRRCRLQHCRLADFAPARYPMPAGRARANTVEGAVPHLLTPARLLRPCCAPRGRLRTCCGASLCGGPRCGRAMARIQAWPAGVLLAARPAASPDAGRPPARDFEPDVSAAEGRAVRAGL